ncbi:type I-C CRISPR-associated protein Cas8c/Csd1 [Bacillus sp. FJAT-50079]|uniref:type I-C CRISPR-associated protein Cas8c/Csd1 n=1 Tax=Bacillus sp. FJAT-50079 TaxID=2833577 RepID=UPI001BC9127C|nr:type I-C CRISPR-associated protein Cas8c/Csd1 [Bacillus sp. FJAT-50079]MBS4209382.1 type I-C CRISPR-associated protein Cas8c/Csd1 [Bacillus sp. FJAT-50079]
MSWMKRLYDVYENNSLQVGVFKQRGEGQRFTLLPISHVTQSAQIEVVLDHEGHFFKATVVPKDRARTIVPATLDSANRSGAKVAAHYLHDKLFYAAGDYLKYGGEEKRAKNYPNYIEQMKDWATGEVTHPKVELIYNYVKKGRLIEDLVNAEVLFVDENNKLIEKWTTQDDKKYGRDKPDIYKVVTGQSSEALVRFTILSQYPGDPVVWEDKSLYQTFQDYLASKMEEKSERGICYITGQAVPLTERHGSRLRNAGDMSKLISSNDDTGFTYRGRFNTPNQAVQIGYDVSQKAHNALRWLIQRQDFRSDSRHFITFGVKEPAVVQPFKGTMDIYQEDPMNFIIGAEVAEVEKDYTNQVIAEQVQLAFKGLKHYFNSEGAKHIIVMAVDAATTGRLSIVYYQELDSELFFDQLSHWHDTCKWQQNYYDDASKKMSRYIGTPSTYHIVEAVYGERADEKIKKELYTRLLPCIVDRAAIPKDIIRTIYNRVKNPMSFKKDLSNQLGEWQRTLNIACALIRKQFEKEEIGMALDLENQNRDYLFGRLLGVAEVLERNELKRRQDDRATNAMRYFNAFSQHPARTWMTIRKQLHPYQVRQGQKMSYYNKLIRDIEDSIMEKDMNNDALGPKFLLGYSSQVNALYAKNERKEENSNDDNSK